jgi:membrane protein required for colicin V production
MLFNATSEGASAVLADVAIILFLVACVLIGFFRGALRQVLALGAWLVAFVVADQARSFISDWLRGQEPDFNAQYADMLAFLVGFVVLFLVALAVIELSGRTVDLSHRPIVEETVGGLLMLFVGLLALSGVLIALGTFYAQPTGGFTAEVELVRQLNAALSGSQIVHALNEWVVPGIQSLLGPLLQPDARHFG